MRSQYSLPMRAAWALAAALVLSLALAHLHPFGDAHLFAASRSQPAQLPASIPPAALAILANNCADCHSSIARAPFYGRFAPISWLLERDIVAARSHLNLSNWDSYSPDRQQLLLAQIAQQAKTGHMPPPQYLLIHRRARLTPRDIATLTAWTHTASFATASTDASTPLAHVPSTDTVILSEAHRAESKDPDGAAPASAARTAPTVVLSSAQLVPRTPLEPRTSPLEPSPTTPDPAAGQSLFNRRCTGCHSLTDNREGPHLGGVYGRPAASVSGFPYSAALTAAHITWNSQTLNQWLTDPDAFVPGANMDFRVPRPDERADIIAFLKSSAH